MFKRFRKKFVKIPVDQVVFVQKIPVKSLSRKLTFLCDLLHCDVLYRSCLHTFFHGPCQPVFGFFTLCQISLVACFSHSFSSSSKYGDMVVYTF